MSEADIRTIGAFTTLANDAAPQAIGAAVQNALNASERLAPAATEQSVHASYEPLLNLTGIATIWDLFLAAKLVTIDEDKGLLTQPGQIPGHAVAA
ncbi:MAG: hypothetical protein ABI240_08480 [Sphingomonas sp.]